MARALISTSVDRDFAKEVTALAKEGHTLAESYADLTERMLVFAGNFKHLWDRAKKLDGADTGKHHIYLREALSELIKTSNKSIRSRWITIGSHAKRLMHYKDALPPYRDSLYEIALALEDEKPVTKWFNDKRITIDSSVREVRSLRGGKQRKAKSASKPSTTLRRSFPATISISFETYTAAAEALSSFLLSSKADFKITAHHAFDAALREHLSDRDYEKAKSRIG
jgi:hypothetical protein